VKSSTKRARLIFSKKRATRQIIRDTSSSDLYFFFVFFDDCFLKVIDSKVFLPVMVNVDRVAAVVAAAERVEVAVVAIGDDFTSTVSMERMMIDSSFSWYGGPGETPPLQILPVGMHHFILLVKESKEVLLLFDKNKLGFVVFHPRLIRRSIAQIILLVVPLDKRLAAFL